MLFNSWAFALFLPTVFVLYWWIRPLGLRPHNLFVLAASYVFYGYWDYRFLGLIVVSSATDYLVGLRLGVETAPARRRGWLGLSLAVNLGVLGFFKYFDFFIESAARVLEAAGIGADVTTLRVILPVGISFYTFQTLSYTIDVYRREIEPTRDAAAFFAFVAFFPQLVAGPIERARHLLPQFLVPRTFALEPAKDGLRLILWGFFKKLVVADNLAPHVETIFANAPTMSGGVLAVGLLLFAFQIYGDFSGYSDIAIGTGRLFGIRLMRNFAYPYFARDIAEFWKRWHISLSTWFRDYVYIPLGGSRTTLSRHARNVVATFALSGLWHGANWTFVVWGLLHGAFYLPLLARRRGGGAAASPTRQPHAAGSEWPAIATTFGVVTLAWAFFRADSMGAALDYLLGMVTFRTGTGVPIEWIPLVLALGGTGALVGVEWTQRAREHALDVAHLPGLARWTIYVAVALGVAFLGNFGELQFVYFQF